MSDAPPESYGTGSTKRRPLSQHGGDGGQMIGIERMAKPEDESDAQYCESVSVWHATIWEAERRCDARRWHP